MSDYKIEKLRCPVRLVFVDGSTVSGDVFLHARSRFREEPQSPAEFLNEPEPYFALAPVGAPPLLVAKETIRRADAPLPAHDDTLDVPRIGLRVEVALAGGDVCVGAVFPEARAGRARLIDYLNGDESRFLAIFDAEKVMLVNRRVVAHIRELQ